MCVAVLDRRVFDLHFAFIDFGLSKRFDRPVDDLSLAARLTTCDGGTDRFWVPEAEEASQAGTLCNPFSADVSALRCHLCQTS